MKKLILCFISLSLLAACSSTPTKYLRQNCESADAVGQACPLNGLCYCENVPKNDREPRH